MTTSNKYNKYAGRCWRLGQRVRITRIYQHSKLLDPDTNEQIAAAFAAVYGRTGTIVRLYKSMCHIRLDGEADVHGLSFTDIEAI